jgi:hypothetical protein
VNMMQYHSIIKSLAHWISQNMIFWAIHVCIIPCTIWYSAVCTVGVLYT